MLSQFYNLRFVNALWMLSRWVACRAYFAYTTITASRCAEFATVKNNLKVQVIPSTLFENTFQIALCFIHITAARKTPALRQSMNMRIDRKARYAKRLCHHNACCFMSNAWKSFEAFKVLRYLAVVFLDQYLAESSNGF